MKKANKQMLYMVVKKNLILEKALSNNVSFSSHLTQKCCIDRKSKSKSGNLNIVLDLP